MAFDFKKEYKEFYMPKNKPQVLNVPKANYIAVRGKGDPVDKTVLLTLGSQNPLWRNGLRTHVFKIAILIATLFIAVSLFYTLSRLYRDTNEFYDMMATWKTL